MSGAAGLVPAGFTVLADSDKGKGSPIGFFVVLVLVIAVYFLYRSMSGHLRKLPESFADRATPGEVVGTDPASTDPAGTDPTGTDPARAESAGPGPGDDPTSSGDSRSTTG